MRSWEPITADGSEIAGERLGMRRREERSGIGRETGTGTLRNGLATDKSISGVLAISLCARRTAALSASR